MVTLSLNIRKSMPNTDGSYNIKIQVSVNQRSTFISTAYNIDSINQWSNGSVVNHPQAQLLNVKLRALLVEYDKILEELPIGNKTATEVRNYLVAQRNKYTDFKGYTEQYIARLKANNQTSYAQNMGYTMRSFLVCFSERISLAEISASTIVEWEKYLSDNNQSSTTINIRMSHLKAILNAAVADGTVEYKIFPFRSYHMPTKNVRDICISREELARLRDAEFTGVSAKRLSTARDLFMLSFYCAGINLTDLMSATFDSTTLTFIRKKTATKKKGSDIQVSITIQPEARAIIDKYIDANNRLDMAYNYTDYEQFRSFITKSLNRIGEMLGFEKKLMFYSARKTFVQFGSEIGIPLYVLEYAIGQTIKEANNRPIFNYLKVMRRQADLAIRTIVDYSFEPEEEEDFPLPDWARRK